jgi:hypothetical protein
VVLLVVVLLLVVVVVVVVALLPLLSAAVGLRRIRIGCHPQASQSSAGASGT